MRNFYKKGISIAEIIVVVAILSVILAVALSQFSEMRERQVLKSAVSNILSSLNKAQAQTTASLQSSSYGVHLESNQVIIFKGMVFSSGDPDNEVMEIKSPANISNVTFGGVSGNSGDVYFNRIWGTPNHIGTITVSTPSLSKIITVSFTGSASAN